MRTRGFTFKAIAAVALLGGVGLVVWDLKFNPRNPGTSDVSVGLSPSPDGVAGAIRFRF